MKHIILVLALWGVGWLAWSAFEDIHLDGAILDMARNSGLILENLEFEREISGELWRLRTPLAERRDGMIEMSSPDVLRTLVSGQEWYFRGRSGIYDEKEETAGLNSLLGTLDVGARVLNLESPYLFWSGNERTFVFPKGVTVYDAEFLLEADTASVDESGVIELERGGVITWTRDGAP